MKFILTLLPIFLVISCSFARENLVADCPLDGFGNRTGVDCGYLEVPENRNNSESRKIRLAYLVLKATGSNPKADPIVYLQGGPGGAALTMANYWSNSILRRDRDFILIDQRGTGFSSAFCPEIGNELMKVIAMDLTPEQEYLEMEKVASACKKTIKANGIDLGGYNTIQNVLDLEDLRKALGYDQWNLFGGSYGSRLALAYMRDFPQNVRTSVISGLFPPQVDLYEKFVSNMKLSLDKVFEGCKLDSECNSDYPNLENTFYEVLEETRRKPMSIPWSGKTFALNAQDLLLLTHQMLYTRSTISSVPRFITNLKNGRDSELRRAIRNLQNRAAVINFGMNWSFNAFDEMSFTNENDFLQDLAKHPELTPGPAFFISDPKLLENWHPHRAPDYVNEPVRSDIPSLVSNGGFDPITPPHNAQSTLQYLSNAYYAEFKNEGHTVFGSCYFQMVKSFLDNPSTAPNMDCVSRNPKINWK